MVQERKWGPLVSAGSREIVGSGGKVVVVLSRLIEKPCIVFLPNKIDIADRAVSLFGNNDLRLSSKLYSFVWFMVVLFAVDKHHHVSILFDSTRFTKVAQSRSMVLGVFGLTV